MGTDLQLSRRSVSTLPALIWAKKPWQGATEAMINAMLGEPAPTSQQKVLKTKTNATWSYDPIDARRYAAANPLRGRRLRGMGNDMTGRPRSLTVRSRLAPACSAGQDDPSRVRGTSVHR